MERRRAKLQQHQQMIGNSCRSMHREDLASSHHHYANMMQQPQMQPPQQPRQRLQPPYQLQQQCHQQPPPNRSTSSYSHPLFREPMDGFVYRAELEPVTSIEQILRSEGRSAPWSSGPMVATPSVKSEPSPFSNYHPSAAPNYHQRHYQQQQQEYQRQQLRELQQMTSDRRKLDSNLQLLLGAHENSCDELIGQLTREMTPAQVSR